ncbi:hypothetical protein BC830DRAFT_1069356, partial [Chytriomyces sp. MP71]
EVTEWSYSLLVPQNVAGLLMLMGSEATFLRRLDAFFELRLFNKGNEPSFLNPTLYRYSGRPNMY